MNSEMNTGETGNSGAIAKLGNVSLGSVILNQDRANSGDISLGREGVQIMRHSLHELANVFTGVMIAGDLLSLHLAEGSLQHYAAEICVGSERGCVLVRAIRQQLLAACGEVEGPGAGTAPGA